MTTRKQRHHLYLPDDLSAALDALGGAPGASKSAVVAEALRTWIDRRATGALDDKLALRLDRITREQQALAHRVDFVAEALGTFIQHQLTLVAHQPAFTPEAAHLGQQRFRQFIDAVGRKVARAGAGHEGEPRSSAMARVREA
jgi:predicted transcriptional regulator